MSSDEFSARDQTLGYLYQAIYALYLLLREKEEEGLSIENLDDVVFEKDGSPQQLIQFKHSIRHKASLQDSSKDLWKTLRIWSSRLYKKEINLPGIILTLITTGEIKENYIAALLGPDDKRNPKLASQRLTNIARTSKNIELKEAFSAYLLLPEDDRALLAECIYILNNSPNILDLPDMIKREVEFAVDKVHINGFYERLEGWWFNEIVLRLGQESSEAISRHELYHKIREIASQFGPESLTIDYLNDSPTPPIDVENDDRLFVIQLKKIAINKERIESCMLDYYRASKQRLKWIRDEPLRGHEICEYDDRLIREWQHISWSHQDNIPEAASEDDLRKCGREIINHVYLLMPYIPIRKNVTEPYVMRGSYHILANERNSPKPPKVYWHPKFPEMIEDTE